jgi:Sigma-70 region 2
VAFAARISSRDSADDVVQDSMVKAHSALLRGDRPDAPRACLFKIARNTALNERRDHRIHEHLDERQVLVTRRAVRTHSLSAPASHAPTHQSQGGHTGPSSPGGSTPPPSGSGGSGRDPAQGDPGAQTYYSASSAADCPDGGTRDPGPGGVRDQDRDGVKNLAEYQDGTNPRQADTDGDGSTDSTDPHPCDQDQTSGSGTGTGTGTGTVPS